MVEPLFLRRLSLLYFIRRDPKFLRGDFGFSSEDRTNSSELSFHSSEVSFHSSEVLFRPSVENFHLLRGDFRFSREGLVPMVMSE